MAKMFDIRPPRPVPKKQKNISRPTNNSKNKKPQSGLLLIIFIICVFILLFSLSNNTSSQYTQADTESVVNNLITTDTTTKPDDNPYTTPSKIDDNNIIKQKTSEQEETIKNNIDSDIQVVVMNGARISGIAETARKTLENNNINVFEVGNTNNPYNKTIIYYTNENIELAKKIEETLSDYKPTLETNSEFANSNKILIIIGRNE